eukprot:5213410-Alexandrium_andersonii.AAC.1
MSASLVGSEMCIRDRNMRTCICKRARASMCASSRPPPRSGNVRRAQTTMLANVHEDADAQTIA